MLLYTPGIEFIFVTKRCSYRVHNYASFIKESRLMFRRSGDSSVLYLVYGLLVPSQRKICIIHGTRRILEKGTFNFLFLIFHCYVTSIFASAFLVVRITEEIWLLN